MKIEKLVIGKTYYIPNGTCNYKRIKLVEILDSKKVLLSDSKGKVFQCFINKLHTVSYKAVKGYKTREGIKQKEREKRNQEKSKNNVEKEKQNNGQRNSNTEHTN